jgi:hypothetical protein
MEDEQTAGVMRRPGILVGITCRPGTWSCTRPSMRVWIGRQRHIDYHSSKRRKAYRSASHTSS